MTSAKTIVATSHSLMCFMSPSPLVFRVFSRNLSALTGCGLACDHADRTRRWVDFDLVAVRDERRRVAQPHDRRYPELAREDRCVDECTARFYDECTGCDDQRCERGRRVRHDHHV